MKLLIVIPCAKRKIWKKGRKHGPVAARDAYTSYPFKVNKAFAERFAGASPDKWMILSAKYGFISPDFLIPRNYDVSFNKPSPERISIDTLRMQVKEKKLRDFELVVALGGKQYRDRIQKAFRDGPRPITPTKSRPRWEQPKYVESLTELDREEMLRRVRLDDHS